MHLHFKDSKISCRPEVGILEKTQESKLFEVEKWYIKKLKPYFNVELLKMQCSSKNGISI